MAIEFHSVLIGSNNPARLISFYQTLAGKAPDETSEDGNFKMFHLGPAVIIIGPHDKIHGPNQTPERLLLNFEADDVAAEADRLKAAGATEVQPLYHPPGDPSMSLITLADPDGNYVQLATRHH